MYSSDNFVGGHLRHFDAEKNVEAFINAARIVERDIGSHDPTSVIEVMRPDATALDAKRTAEQTAFWAKSANAAERLDQTFSCICLSASMTSSSATVFVLDFSAENALVTQQPIAAGAMYAATMAIEKASRDVLFRRVPDSTGHQ